jgi:hypothetical protein
MGTYSPSNPSFWSVGSLLDFTGKYDGNIAHFIRYGASFGQLTLNFASPYVSTPDKKEYWRKGGYAEMLIGYAFQFGFVNAFAFRLGADALMVSAQAMIRPHSTNESIPVTFSFTGIGGLVLFPKGDCFFRIDVCPGFVVNPGGELARDLDFVMPIRIVVGLSSGPDLVKPKKNP